MSSSHPFDPEYDELPGELPIFPLSGVLLLPGGRLPLNIFEPRYLNMIRDALRTQRMIGMVQPAVDDADQTARFGSFEVEDDEEAAYLTTEPQGTRFDAGAAPVYRTGCAGRIVSFSETDDGRYLVTLKGLLRFRITEELALQDGYRRVIPDFSAFSQDLTPEQAAYFDRDRLLEALTYYFTQQGIEADWEAIREASNERLVTSLAMVCPFSSAEKQALLEARDASQRAETMTAILEMAVLDRPAPEGRAASRH
jgi:Lon protease-like protein